MERVYIVQGWDDYEDLCYIRAFAKLVDAEMFMKEQQSRECSFDGNEVEDKFDNYWIYNEKVY